MCYSIGNIGYILGFYRDNGEENGGYYIIIGYSMGNIGHVLGFYKNNGEENGSYYIMIGYIW